MSRNKIRSSHRLGFESLEGRLMMAASITSVPTAVAGQFEVRAVGSVGNDRINVTSYMESRPNSGGRTGTFTIQVPKIEVRIMDAGGATRKDAAGNYLVQSFEQSKVGRISISGDLGDDTITNDSTIDSSLYGDDGNDTIYGGSGADDIFGDKRLGGVGNDKLYGRGGADNMRGGSLNDELWGGPGDDILEGDDGIDILYGGENDDTLWGNAGDDKLYGESGNDELHGGSENDQLVGGEGADMLFGDTGSDAMFSDFGGDDFTCISFGQDDQIYYDVFDSVDGNWGSVLWFTSGSRNATG